MEIKFVYVVYKIGEEDLDDLRIFDESWKAKEYVKEQKEKGIKLYIWQRPIE